MTEKSGYSLQRTMLVYFLLIGIASLSVRWDETVFVPVPPEPAEATAAAASPSSEGAGGPPAGAQ